MKMALNIGALYLRLCRIWGSCQKIWWCSSSSLEQWVNKLFSFASLSWVQKMKIFFIAYLIIHLNYFSFHSTENNQYSASNFYSAPTGQSVYSYSAPASQPSRESSESAKPVYLSSGRAPLATHQTGILSILIPCCNSLEVNEFERRIKKRKKSRKIPLQIKRILFS